jgi:uncharacterized membrane protein YbhN (UPF0104 family)
MKILADLFQKKNLKWLIYPILLCFFVWVYYRFQSEFKNVLYNLSWSNFSYLILLQIFIIGSGGFPFKILCLPLNIHIHWRDWFGLSFAASLLNQALPYRPGLAFRYVYLKSHYGLKGADFFAVMFVYLILMLASALCLAFLACFSSDLPAALEGKLLPALGYFLVMILILMLIRAWSKHKNITLPGMHALQKIWHHPWQLIWSTLSILLALLAGSFAFYLIFSQLHSPLPIGQCIFLISLLSLSMLIPITPGNIGIAEAIIGTMTQILYGDFTQGFMAVLLFRLSQFTVATLVGGPFLAFFANNKVVN